MPPRATPHATAQFAARSMSAQFHRVGWDNLMLASIGLGTYLGEPDILTDARYIDAIRRYWALGGNVVDTSINYRFQRSERNVGMALKTALQAGALQREEVVLCTKGGYIPFDNEWPNDPDAWVQETFITPGVVAAEEIVEGYCMAPAYLRHQIAQSRKNLGVECIDLYYLHNPEGQRAELGEAEFITRLRAAFTTLEQAVADGEIAAYGTATWNGYRAHPRAPDYLSLETVLNIAREIAGDQHHFRAVQLPFNFQMLEAFRHKNQPSANGLQSLLAVAHEQQIVVFGSASLFQSRVVGRLPGALRAKFDQCETDAQRALQFVRSTPGLTVALVGMSHADHVEENLKLRHLVPLTPEAHLELLG